MVGDSFIYPVKEFAVDTESGGIVVLEFDIGAGKGDYFGTGGGANGEIMHTCTCTCTCIWWVIHVDVDGYGGFRWL